MTCHHFQRRFWQAPLCLLVCSAFDQADVHWFRGQCHGVMAVCEFVLAHDWRKMLDHLYSTGSLDGTSQSSSVDAVAAIHLIDWPVAEPKRMPGPRQTSVIPGLRVTQQMVDAWHEFLDEASALLAGEKLIPYWRTGGEGLGVNLRRVFTEPREFDLILWVHGSAAVPYLEEGDLTSADAWRRLQNVFGGQFIGFTVRFN